MSARLETGRCHVWSYDLTNHPPFTGLVEYRFVPKGWRPPSKFPHWHWAVVADVETIQAWKAKLKLAPPAVWFDADGKRHVEEVHYKPGVRDELVIVAGFR